MSLDFHSEDADAAVASAYAVPARLGILRSFPSPSPLTALSVIRRIMEEREQFQKRYDKKSKAEDEYVANKSYVQEG
jgi:hypothetical protein